MQLTQPDLELVVRRMPKDVRQLLLDNPGKLSVGGGFIRAVVANEEVSDVDFFGPDRDFLDACAETVKGKRDKYRTRVIRTKNAITLATENRLPLQFITRWLYAHPSDVIADLDFTVCQAVVFVDPETSLFSSYIGDTFYSDLAAKRLVYTAPVRDEEAGGSMLRVIKYVRRGYRIRAGCLGAVVARVVEKYDPDRTDHISMAQFAVARMQEVDPLMVVDGMPVDETETVDGLSEGGA